MPSLICLVVISYRMILSGLQKTTNPAGAGFVVLCVSGLLLTSFAVREEALLVGDDTVRVVNHFGRCIS